MMRAAQYRARARDPVLRHLLRLPVGDGRVRAQRVRPRRRRLDRVRARHADQGDLQAARPARRRRPRRHDAPRLVRVPAEARLAVAAALRRPTSSTSGTATATSSTASTSRRSPRAGPARSSGGRSTASSSRWSSCRRTPGSWPCSSTRSSSRSRCARTRCSPASSRRRHEHKQTRLATGRGRRHRSPADAGRAIARCRMAAVRRYVQIGPVRIGGGAPLALIGGPCVIESEAHAVELALAIARDRARPRACRTSSRRRSTRPTARRSPRSGARASTTGLRVLAEVKRRARVPVLTDIHEAWQAEPVAGRRRRPADPRVPVPPDRPARRGGAHGPRRQHQEGPVPRARRHAARRRARCRDVGQRPRRPHRARRDASATTTWSSTCGRSRMMRALGAPVVFDVTHSLQLPGAGDGVTAGQAEFIETAGLRPASPPASTACSSRSTRTRRRAKSDAQNALRLDRLAPLLATADARARGDRRRGRRGPAAQPPA